MGVNSINSKRIKFNVTLEGPRCQLNDNMKRDCQIGQLFMALVLKVCQDGSQYCLMPDDEDVFLSFQLHDDGLEAKDQVSIRFTIRIAVMKLVLVSGCKVVRIALLKID
jgi:hypothetical protein